MKKYIYKFLFLSALPLLFISCSKDFIETEFPQENPAKPLTSIQELQSFINGTYAAFRHSTYYGADYQGFSESRSDEVFVNGSAGYYVSVASYTMLAGDTYPTRTYSKIYEAIGLANVAISTSPQNIEGYNLDPEGITNQVNKLKGEAYALRAIAFFDALRLYGQKYTSGEENLGIVLPLTRDATRLAARATVAETEAQIESDFSTALSIIGTGSYPRPNALDATSIKALMTRYYLYKEDYTKVSQLVSDVVATDRYKVLNSSQLINSYGQDYNGDSIFEIAVGQVGALGSTGYAYRMNSAGYGCFQLLPSTEALYSQKDVRRNLFVDYSGDYFLDNKFPDLVGALNVKVMRYEELLLNGAEAELKLGNKAKAMQYVNDIVTNRGLVAVTDLSEEDVKDERVRELVGEGLRYWDLLRWKKPILYYDQSGVNDSSKDKSIPNNLLAFPIPETETNVAGSPVKANPGYNNY